MAEKKGAIDSLFDFADKIVDGAAAVLKDVPEPPSDDDDDPPVRGPDKRVIDVPTDSPPLLKSGHQAESKPATKKMREVTLGIRNVSQRRGGGVNIIAETPTHELVVVVLSEEDWKKVVDTADWLRMVPE